MPTVLLSHTLGDRNPYTTLLAEAVTAADATVRPFSSRALRRDEVDVWHLQWPDAIAARGTLAACWADLLRLVAHLVVARIRRVTVIWTVHNAHTHDARRPRLDRWVRRVLARGVDGWIALSPEAATVVEGDPAMARVPHRVVPHGDYRTVHPPAPTRSEARRELELPADATVLLFFGLIRPYKNVPTLLTTFRHVADPAWRLLVCGQTLQEDEDLLYQLAGDDARIWLELGYVDDVDVPRYFAACDLVVLPFRDILNSGSAILALSFDRPVLVPDRGSMPSLHRQVGPPWVQLYDGELAPEVLEAAVRAAREAHGTAPLDELSWDRIGRRTVAAYGELARRARGPEAGSA